MSGAAYSRDEIDQILDWAHYVADGHVPLKRAIKMWEARQQAIAALRVQARVS